MKRSGWPPGLLQDDCRGLSMWFAGRADARRLARAAAAEIVENNGMTAKIEHSVHEPERYIDPVKLCPAVFRGHECRYAGEQAECDKTLRRCTELGNQANYRGQELW